MEGDAVPGHHPPIDQAGRYFPDLRLQAGVVQGPVEVLDGATIGGAVPGVEDDVEDLPRRPTVCRRPGQTAACSPPGAGRAPRTSPPGRSPVGAPSWKVTIPDFTVQR